MCLLSFSFLFKTFCCVAYHVIPLACNSYFSAGKSSRELQTARSFPDPKATVFFCFHLEEYGDFICYEVSGTILSSVGSLLSASCSLKLVALNTARSRPSGISNISCQFEVY